MLLLFEFAFVVEDFHGLQFWAKLLDRSNVVELEFPLFDKLHTCDASNHFGAGGNPEDGFHGHWFLAANPNFAGGVLEDDVALFVDCSKSNTGSTIWIRCDLIHGGFEAINGRGLDLRHVKVFSGSEREPWSMSLSSVAINRRCIRDEFGTTSNYQSRIIGKKENVSSFNDTRGKGGARAARPIRLP